MSLWKSTFCCSRLLFIGIHLNFSLIPSPLAIKLVAFDIFSRFHHLFCLSFAIKVCQDWSVIIFIKISKYYPSFFLFVVVAGVCYHTVWLLPGLPWSLHHQVDQHSVAWPDRTFTPILKGLYFKFTNHDKLVYWNNCSFTGCFFLILDK